MPAVGAVSYVIAPRYGIQNCYGAWCDKLLLGHDERNLIAASTGAAKRGPATEGIIILLRKVMLMVDVKMKQAISNSSGYGYGGAIHHA